MQVEPAMSRRRSTKVAIRNLPPHISKEEVEHFASSLGPVVKCEQVGAEGVVYVTFESPDQSQQAVTQLNGYDYQGSVLKVDFASGGGPRGVNRKPGRPNDISNMNRQQQQQQQQELPLRYNKQNPPLKILVGQEYVGAVIGRQGQTIKNITSQTRARVDILRKPYFTAMSETLVTIKGSPESCSSACKEIMKVVQKEAQTLNRGDVPLRILCPNSLCGRIIGKKGSVIKSCMDETDTHIVVSSVMDMNSQFMDRVITITGANDDMSKAEEKTSEKMRSCFQQDAQNYSPQQQMMLGMPPSYGMSGMMPNNYPGMRQYGQYGMQNNYHGPPGIFGAVPPPPQQQQALEITFLFIPESAVGAVIGSKGSNIKSIMRLSNARIKIIQQNKNDNDKKSPPSMRLEERKVIITGSPEAQWKAQFYIYEKIKSEQFSGNDEVHLRSEIVVPRGMIGRIIGKGGQNVKEMQRVSGAIVKLPDSGGPGGEEEEVSVTIIGHFYASQSAQRRIRALMNQVPNTREPGGHQRRPRPGREQNGN